MSPRIVVDMNLSVEWVTLFEREGWEAAHWSDVGDPRAADAAIMDWARSHGFAVFTHDLDFGAALALTAAEGPSVIQVRAQRVLPEHLGPVVLTTIRRHEAELSSGAIIVVEPTRSRVRILPL